MKTILGGDKYGAKLSTPEWKKFSQGIRTKRGNYCNSCRRSDIVLNVHHVFYESDREPWEYADDEVVVLCSGCHHQLHEQLKKFRKYVFGKLTPQAFEILNGALAVALEKYDGLVFAHALAEFVSTPSMVERYAKAWNMTAEPKKERPYIPNDPVVLTRTKLSDMQSKRKLDWKDIK
jgi:hypothetical protein